MISVYSMPPCWVSWGSSLLDVLGLTTHLRTARRRNSLTSTSHRFDSELKRLAAEMGGTGGKEGANAPVFGQTVQARLPPNPTRTPHTQ